MEMTDNSGLNQNRSPQEGNDVVRIPLEPQGHGGRTVIRGTFGDYLRTRIGGQVIDRLEERLKRGTVPFLCIDGQVPALRLRNVQMFRKSDHEIYADFIIAGNTGWECDPFRSRRVRMTIDLEAEHPVGVFRDADIAVFRGQERSPGWRLDQNLIPYIRKEQYDIMAEEILSRYMPGALSSLEAVDVEALVRSMGLKLVYLDLDGCDMVKGAFFLRRSAVPFRVYGEHRNYMVEPGTILINRRAFQGERNAEREIRLTIIHECCHAYLHRLQYLGQKLLNLESQTGMFVHQVKVAWQDQDRESPAFWMELQARRISARVAMPRRTVEPFVQVLLTVSRDEHCTVTDCYNRAVSMVAETWAVSRESAGIRLNELGFGQIRGIGEYVDGREIQDYDASQLSADESVTLSKDQIEGLQKANGLFAQELDRGRYVYAEGHVCVNSPKYVSWDTGEALLTDYARSHIRECCIVFRMQPGISVPSGMEGRILYRKKSQSAGLPAAFTPPLDAIREGKVSDVEIAVIRKKLSNLVDMRDALPASPGETLQELLRISGLNQEVLAEQVGISSRTMRRLKSGEVERCGKQEIWAIGYNMNLDLVLLQNLLQKFLKETTTTETDLIYTMVYKACRGQKSLPEVNEILVQFGVEPWGGRIKRKNAKERLPEPDSKQHGSPSP